MRDPCFKGLGWICLCIECVDAEDARESRRSRRRARWNAFLYWLGGRR